MARLAQALEKGPPRMVRRGSTMDTGTRQRPDRAVVPYPPHAGGVSNLLHRMGFSPQVPTHRTVDRDEDAIVTWRRETWPAGKR
jgi:transposase